VSQKQENKLSVDIVTGRGCFNDFCGLLKLDFKSDSPSYIAADVMTSVEH